MVTPRHASPLIATKPRVPKRLQRPQTSRPIVVDVVRSEWIKLRSVRSTYWTLLVVPVAMIGLGVLFASRFDHLSPSARVTANPASYSLSGFFLAQLAIGSLGVLIMTNEYSSGGIRATFAAVPQRITLLHGKIIVLTAVAAVVGIASSFGAFFAGQAALSGQTAVAHLGDPGVLRAVIGSGLYLTLVALLGLAFGALIRRSAGAVAALFGLVFVLPGLVAALPSSWQSATRFLPSATGQAIIGRTKFAPTHVLSPWLGFGLFSCYAAFALVSAAFLLRSRDA